MGLVSVSGDETGSIAIASPAGA